MTLGSYWAEFYWTAYWTEDYWPASGAGTLFVASYAPYWHGDFWPVYWMDWFWPSGFLDTPRFVRGGAHMNLGDRP